MNDFPPQMDVSPEQTDAASAASQQEAWQWIGERVRAARIAAHLTQQNLAGVIYTKSYISGVERGKMTPSLQALRFLAKRLGVSHAFLLGEGPSGPELKAAPSAAGSSVPTPEEAAHQEWRARLRSQAEGCLQEGRYEEALALGALAEEPILLHRIHDAYGAFLAAQGRYEEAYEQLRLAQDPMRATNAEVPLDAM